VRKKGEFLRQIDGSLPRPQSGLSCRTDGALRNAIRKANQATALGLVPTIVHAVKKVAEAVVKVTSGAALIHSPDCMTNLRNALAGTPQSRHFVIGEFSILPLLCLAATFCAHRFLLRAVRYDLVHHNTL